MICAESQLASINSDVAEHFTALGLVSLLDMLRNYFPIYDIGLRLQHLLTRANLFKDATSLAHRDISKDDPDSKSYRELLDAIQSVCENHGLTHTAKLTIRAIARFPPKTYNDLSHELSHLNDSLSGELEDESIFRIPPGRKDYFEQDDLFGSEVSVAFPSCARDIRKAGSCFALEQEDACVYHLMQVLERGLNALAAKFNVPFDYRNWQPIIGAVEAKVKGLPPGKDRHFYQDVVAQFGFLKDAYRNHADHVHDDKYDLDKALSILNHVRDFMQALVEGGLAEQ